MGGEENAVFSIDTEFVTNSLDAVSIQAVVQAWQAGAIPEADMWSSMRKLGVIDSQKSDEDIKAELDAAEPSVTEQALRVPGVGPNAMAALKQAQVGNANAIG